MSPGTMYIFILCAPEPRSEGVTKIRKSVRAIHKRFRLKLRLDPLLLIPSYPPCLL